LTTSSSPFQEAEHSFRVRARDETARRIRLKRKEEGGEREDVQYRLGRGRRDE
jgi:hypothetical protein